MGTISSGIGLISGIDIRGTVDQLIAIEARPKQLLESRNTVLQSQATAYNEVSARLLSFKGNTSPLLAVRNFRATSATSSNTDVLNVSSNSTTPAGSYQIAVDRLVTTQQVISRGFLDRDQTALPASTLTFESAAARLDSKTLLTQINGGSGVTRGKISITDELGKSAVIDLSKAVDIDDVVDAINNSSAIGVQASVNGDRLVLTDTTTGTATSTLSITDEVGYTGVTASLGLNTTQVSGVITGSQIRKLSDNSLLDSFNDRNGVRIKTGFNVYDLTITDRTGAVHQIDLNGLNTIAEVRAEVEKVSSNAVTFGVATDGVSVQFTDKSGGSGNFTIAAANSSSAADDLGVGQSVASTTITGTRQIAGLNSKLVRNLRGGTGGALGTITILDRLGNSVATDISKAGSVSEVIKLINDDASSSGVSITVSLNDKGNGLLITDSSGGTVKDLIVANSGGLNIDGNYTTNTVDTGNLQLRYVSEATRLDQLNNNNGVAAGKFTIFDSAGNTATIDLTQGEKNIGEVISEINSKSNINVLARINDNGDGILLEDTNPNTAAFAMKVEEAGSSTARDLGLLGEATTSGGNLDGSFEVTINIAAPETVTGTTLLKDLNGGDGVDIAVGQADFQIETKSKQTYSVNLSGSTTVQNVIDAIAAATSGDVTATLNSSNNGLRLVDNTTGTETFKVTVLNGSDGANDLGILSSDSDADGEIIGSKIVEDTTINSLITRINDSNANVTATVIDDGSPNTPFRLSFTSNNEGTAGAFIVDDSGLGLNVSTLTEAKDAVIFYGGGDPARSVLVTSSTNQLGSLIPGATIDLLSASNSPVTITVNRDDSAVAESVQSFIDSFNEIIDVFNKHDSYDTETQQRGLLLGDSTIQQARSSLYRLVTKRFTDVDGQYTSLSQVGITVGSGAKLEFDAAKFSTALENDRDAVERLFSFVDTERDKDNKLVVVGRGAAKSFDELLERLTDSIDGTFQRTLNTLDNQIEANVTRIERFDVQLEAKRQRLLAQFNNMERVLAELQGQSSALAGFSPVSFSQ